MTNYLNRQTVAGLTDAQRAVAREVARGVGRWRDDRAAAGQPVPSTGAVLLTLLVSADAESSLNPRAVGDNGQSVGLYQFNFGSPSALGSQARAAGVPDAWLTDAFTSTVLILRFADRASGWRNLVAADRSAEDLLRYFTAYVERPAEARRAEEDRVVKLRTWLSDPQLAQVRGFQLDRMLSG